MITGCVRSQKVMHYTTSSSDELLLHRYSPRAIISNIVIIWCCLRSTFSIGVKIDNFRVWGSFINVAYVLLNDSVNTKKIKLSTNGRVKQDLAFVSVFCLLQNNVMEFIRLSKNLT